MEDVRSEISSKNRGKSVKTLCRLSSPVCASARCVRSKEGRDILVVSSGNELIHVLEGGKVEQTINVHSAVVKILEVQGRIWVITKDGKLWAISIPRNKHLEQKDVSMDTDGEIEPSSTGNVEIFANLLGNGDVSERPKDCIPIMVTSPSPVEQCSKENVIQWELGLRDIAVGPCHVVTCCAEQDGVKLSVYSRVDLHGDTPLQSRTRTEEHLRILSSPLSQTKLTSDVMVRDNPGNHEPVTVLLYLEPGDQAPSMCASTTIDQRLFHVLFRTQMGSKLPVVLLGLHSGLVGYITVGVENHDTSVPPEVLYHLEQPVVAMFVGCLTHEDSKAANSGLVKSSDTLVLVGALGKLVFIMLQDSEGLGTGNVQFREYHVPGPVVCAVVNPGRNVLFYSTLKELFAVPLKYSQKSEDNVRPHKPSSPLHLPPSLSPIALTLPKISALAFQESCPDTTSSSLVCFKTDGRVLLFQKPLTFLEKGTIPHSDRATNCKSGERIKRYLADIQEKSDCVNQLNLEIRELDDIIKQLNVATHILCDVLRNQEQQAGTHFTESHSEKPGIIFSVHVDYEAQGGFSYPRVILRCRLVNSTKFSLSRGWSLVVQVRTKEPWFNESCQASKTLNHSVSFDSSSSYHISVPLDPSLSYLSPINISCFICFDMNDILPKKFLDLNHGLQSEGFAVLVRCVQLNILSFLRTIDGATGVSHHSRSNSSRQIHLLRQTLTNSNRISQPCSSTTDQSSKRSGQPMFSIHLSREAVAYIRNTVMKHKSDETPTESSSEELSLLQFFLFNSMKHLRFDDAAIRGNYIVARTPNEDEVKFQVVRLSQGTSAVRDGLELRIHTSSEALRCAVHCALLSELQPVLKRDPQENSKISVGELQKRLTKLKEIQASLDLLRLPSPPVEGNTEQEERYRNTIEKLVKIYEELRQIPTIIP